MKAIGKKDKFEIIRMLNAGISFSDATIRQCLALSPRDALLGFRKVWMLNSWILAT